MKISTFPTIEKLVSVAVKGGHNEKDATLVIGKAYDFLKEVWSKSSPVKLVNIAYATY